MAQRISPLTMQTSLKLPKALKAQIDEVTEKTGKPMSRIIREALEEYLNENAHLLEQKKAA